MRSIINNTPLSEKFKKPTLHNYRYFDIDFLKIKKEQDFDNKRRMG